MKATPIALMLAGVLASPLCAAGLDAKLILVDGSSDDVRVNLTLTNVNVLLMRDTNVTGNVSTLVSNVNQVITRHWLLRSAFKEKKPKQEPAGSGTNRPVRTVKPPGGW